MVLGFLTRLLPYLNQTMTTGWQPPAKVSQPASLKPSPVDSFNREKISPKPLSFSGTPLPEPPRSSFLSRLMSHSAAMSNFPEAISVDDIRALETMGTTTSPVVAKPTLPLLPAASGGRGFRFFKPRTDVDWMSSFLRSAAFANFPEAIGADDIQELVSRDTTISDFDIPDFAINALSHKHSLADKIKIGGKSALALKLEEQLHRPSDKAVSGDAFRKETSDAILASGRKVVWSETTGLAEVGTGAAGTIPVGTFGKLGAGFKGSAMVQYRIVQPIAFKKGQDADAMNPTQVILPTAPNQLVGLAAGTEFEIKGKATVTGHASAKAGHTVGTGPIRAGANASIGASVLHSGEVSLTMKVLDSRGIVQVTVNRQDETAEKLSADLFAGLQSHVGMPNVGSGVLRHVIQNELTRPIAKAVRNHASVSAGMKAGQRDTDKNVATYTIDLTSPNGFEACRSLMNLSTGTAQTLSGIEGSGVTSKRLDTITNRDTYMAHVSYGGNKLLLHNRLREEKEVRFTGSGKTMVYRENQFQEATGNPITGKREISWDAVSIDKPGAENDKTFFNMKFSADKLFTTNNILKRFLTFSDQLSPEYKGVVDAELPKMSVLDHIFTDRDNAKINVDIYFTQAGIDRIDAVDEPAARAAYLRVQEELEPQSKGLINLNEKTVSQAEEIARLYETAQTERYLPDSGGQFEMTRLEAQYSGLTGRELNKDFCTLVGSQEFSSQIKNFQGDRKPEKIRAFFSELGQSTELDYMPTISALASLAGAEETLVNQLSMQGPNVSIQTVSEGKIAHPATTIAKLMEAQRVEPVNSN